MNFLFNKNSAEQKNQVGVAELLDNKKYIVLKFWSGIKEWNVVSVSKNGVSHFDAQTIFNYEVKYGKTDPHRLIIVEVPEI